MGYNLNKDDHGFNVGDLVVNKTAKILFSSDIDVLYYGLFFIEVSEDEVLIIIGISQGYVTVRTEAGNIGWQAGRHFELLQKAHDS